jgi:hypothetical protein
LKISGLKLLGWLVVICLLSAVAWLHCAGRIDLVTADLGRHLVNGHLFLSSGKILFTNFYSASNADFPALCHHWGIGPFFYAVGKAWGFEGLSYVYTGVLFATFGLALVSARCLSFTGAAVLCGVLALPLIGSRVEIRPEGASTLFLMAEFFILSGWRRGRLREGWLWVIPPLQMLWINIHILFFIGLLLTLIYAVDEWLRCSKERGRRVLTGVMATSLAASLMSPFVLYALSQPFTIFPGYGYMLAENQSVFFMMRRFPANPLYKFYAVMLAVSFGLVFFRMLREKTWRRAFPQALGMILLGVLGARSVRSIAMFGFFCIPVMAESLGVLIAGAGERARRLLRGTVSAAAVILVILAAAVPYFYLSPVKKYSVLIDDKQRAGSLFYILARPPLWSGLQPGVQSSADFFKKAGLKGPVFNNYDIGGYFIYHFFPAERPFVDNRPEAYPVNFFTKIYGPMQADETVWARQLRQDHFEVIYFYRHDMTPDAQPFLIRRLNDPQWAPVFVDNYTIILARRGGVNQALISRYELPRSMFKASAN